LTAGKRARWRRLHDILHNGRARLLAAMIPNAKLEKITGASHLLIGTHTQKIAALIAAHVRASV
jgi:pimeloyl-ACP methyl ester carboxylesterase